MVNSIKEILFISFIGIMMCSCSSYKTGITRLRYFDENNIEISKSKFNQIRSTNLLLDIKGDSAHHKRLILREEHGKITNRPFLETLLEKESHREIDADKPIVIIYYPGKDPCNSNGSTTKEYEKKWFGELEDGIHQIAQTNPIYVYKDKIGLEKYEGVLIWYKDPDSIIERLFFKHHYPCSSFVVISKDGNYISYFGEFAKEYVWEATQLMKL